MAPLYELVVDEFKLKPDTALLKKMKEANTQALKDLDAKLEDAEKNFGETEIWDVLLQKAEYMAKICDKVDTLQTT
jgi:26S proteasome regulatory subunit N7